MSRVYEKLKYIKSRFVVFEIDFGGLLLLKILLEYSCFTMLCWFLLYSKVDKLYVYIYLLFFGFPSHLGCHRMRVGFFELYSRFSIVIYFIHSITGIYMSIAISQFIPYPPPSFFFFFQITCFFPKNSGQKFWLFEDSDPSDPDLIFLSEES